MARVVARLAVVLSFLCLFLIGLGAVAGIDPTVKPEAATTAEPTATAPVATAKPSSSASATPTDPRLTAFKNDFEFVFGAVTRAANMIQALWTPLVGLLVLVLATLLIKRVIEEWPGDRLEFDPLKNGTGVAELNDALPGLEAIVREKLLSQLKHLQHSIDQYSNPLAAGAPFPSRTPWLQDAENKVTLEKVIDALGDDSPKYAKSLLSLWRYVFPSRGLRVRMTLQGDGDSTQPIGITFEFLDLRKAENSTAYTVYEEKAIKPTAHPWMLCSPVALADTQEEKPAAPIDALPQKRPRSWLLEVAAALDRASLYADAVPYYEKALAETKNDRDIAKAIVMCQKKLARRTGSGVAFAAAARLEEQKLLEEAIETYANIFPDDGDVKAAIRLWQVVLNLQEGSKGAALDQLATAYGNADKADLREEAVGLYKRAVEQGHVQSAQTLKRIQMEQSKELVTASRLLSENAQWVAAEMYLAKALEAVPDDPDAMRLQVDFEARKPTQENQEALAALIVGKLYHSQGRRSKATEYFVQSLEKQPDYTEAQEALSDILAHTIPLAARFVALLDNALIWLAVELFRQHTDRNVTSGEAGQFRKAQYHNFYGAHLMTTYEELPAFIAQRAQDEFLAARKASPIWWFPPKQLGDLYFERALNTPDRLDARGLLRNALIRYDEALSKFDFRPNAIPTLLRDAAQQRTQVNRHVTALLCCPDAAEQDRLWADIQAVEEKIRVDRKRLNNIPVREKEFRLVYYNLAMWYAVVAYRFDMTRDPCGRPDPKNAKNWARFYLTCAILLEPASLNDAKQSVFLKRLFTEDEWKELIQHIRLRRSQPKKSDYGPEFYWEDVDTVLKQVDTEFSISLPKEA